MSWWTTVSGLTPIMVVDAEGVSGASLLDKIGTNHLSASSTLLGAGTPLFAVAGNSAVMHFASSISVPANCVVAALVKPTRRWIGLSNDAPGYGLWSEASGNWYSSNDGAGVVTLYGAAGPYFGQWLFAAIIKTGTTCQMVVNGVAVGGPYENASYPTTLNRFGHASLAEYNLDADEYLSAAAVWTGTASLPDVQALEAACRAAMLFTPTYRAFTPAIGLTSHAPSVAIDSTGLRTTGFAAALGKGPDIHFGGTGHISGTIKNTANTPVRRRVALIDEPTRTLIREVWSDAITGAYAFKHVALGSSYTVLSYDHTQAYRAVVADRVVPEVLP